MKLTIEQVNDRLKSFDIICLNFYSLGQKSNKLQCLICNNTFETRINDITNNKCRPCKCGKKQKHYILFEMMEKKEKIGALTIKSSLGKDENGRDLWLLECDCGREIKITSGNLLRRDRKSYTSCSCQQAKKGNSHSSWTGYEEISGTYFTTIKSGATLRKLLFKITIEDIWKLFLKQNRKCAFSGRILYFGDNQTASLDRIDSSKGYTLDNIQWVHTDINIMKNNYSDEYFIEICKEITKYRRNK